MGFHGHATACKSHITKYNAMRQMKWYKAWYKALDSGAEETCSVCSWQSKGRRVWWLPGQDFLPDCTVPTLKFGGEGIMVWVLQGLG